MNINAGNAPFRSKYFSVDLFSQKFCSSAYKVYRVQVQEEEDDAYAYRIVTEFLAGDIHYYKPH